MLVDIEKARSAGNVNKAVKKLGLAEAWTHGPNFG